MGCILQIKYEDYELTAERKDVLSQLVDNFILNISEEFNGMYQPVCIEYEQHSENWLKLRQCRITATKVKSVLSIMSNNGRSRLLNEIVWGHRLIQTAAMKYGCDKEAVAMQEYLRVKSQQVKNFDAKVTGLWVNPKWPLFGCSPDGIVTDPSSNPLVGLLEIKCPFILRNSHPTDFSKLSATQINAFCCTLDNNVLKLKKSHQYYYQVQFAMAVMEMTWCDFVIWTPYGISIERVQFEFDWPKVSYQLLQSCKSWIIPEYFEMKVPRRLNVCAL